MFAIAFDLTVEETERRHPKGVSQAYSDIRQTLDRFGFERIKAAFMSVAAKISAICSMR